MIDLRVAPHYLYRIGAVLVVLFALDRIVKAFAVARIPERGSFLCDRACGFIVERNTGVAFSIPLSVPTLVVVVIVIMLVLIWMLRDGIMHNERPVVWGTGLMIIGASANALDRIRFGYVIDFIRITRWPTFNLADVYIIIGVSTLVGFYLLTRNSYARSPHNSNASRD